MTRWREPGARLTKWPSGLPAPKESLDLKDFVLVVATIAGDVGQPSHVVSALLGHRNIGGGLHAGYNQSRYQAEVASALQMVADLLDSVAAGKDNIIIATDDRG